MPILRFACHDSADTDLALHAMLRAATRSAGSAVDPLLAGVTVEKVLKISAAARGGAAAKARQVRIEAPQLLALEAEDGTTVFIRSDKLAEDIARLRPAAVVDGAVDFARFSEANAAARGLGDILWKAVSVLSLPDDGVLAQAGKLARQWAGGALADQAADAVCDVASVLGAKALMWQIESSLAGRPGIYHWQNETIAAGDLCPPGDPRLARAARGEPMLLLIHGTASYTCGTFADLRADKASWEALRARFPGGIFGYEHRTFSQSPVENALEALQALPAGARVSLLTHSRGGLVGDLLCLGQVEAAAIAAYRIDTREAADAAGLKREEAEEQARLRQILKLQKSQGIRIERYVRVACPARGTRFLSDNLDAALSDFLNVVQVAGGALFGAVAGALGGPAAATAVGDGASSALGVLKRLLLEIAGRRIDPRLVPGIAAMRVDSPLAAFLAHPGSRRRDGVDMAVIAGDTEFDGLGLSSFRRRIANLFCDWRLFDGHDNDLVVDTDSMYAGLGFTDGTRYLYDQDESVTHFRYFRNPPTRDGLCAWLTEAAPGALGQFLPVSGGARTPWRERDVARARRGGERPENLPVLIFLPGIMGTHLEIDRDASGQAGTGDRIWFNFWSLNRGKLDRIADADAANVFPEDLWERFYADLADFLGETHELRRFPYDWRRPLEVSAGQLKICIEELVAQYPGRPIRILAHSMGGLVVRTLISKHPAAWRSVVASGGRLLMLGTPNNGAHLIAHTLLGKTDSMRMLERIDVEHDLQHVVDIVAGFPGALSLLPRPGFADAGPEPRIAAADYYDAATWLALNEKNSDRWYDDRVGGRPTQAMLKIARDFWESTLASNEIADPERVAQIFGQAAKTPCGVVVAGDKLELLFTPEGDGSVTWASGRLANLNDDERCWTMPVEHADLTASEDYFPAIAELLDKGSTDKLDRLPRRRGAPARSFVLEAPPPVRPSEDELARACLGSGPRRRRLPQKAQVSVGVRAGDLRYVDQPVICGHYINDPISGAETTLDELLHGRLSERERLGVYASEVGTSAIVLRQRSAEEAARGSRPGALIVGLGDYNGQLGSRDISETVRAAVLRFLLLLRDAGGAPAEAPVCLYSLLIGWNSTAHISIDESVAAVTRGVLEANYQFRQTLAAAGERGATVGRLCFVELYRDAAITAAYAVRNLPQALAGELHRLGARIDAERTLSSRDGVLERLAVDGAPGQWARLIVTDADAADGETAPRTAETACPPAPPASAAPNAAPPRYAPRRLRYVLLARRARAESMELQRQPELIEKIIHDQRAQTSYNAKLAGLLFHLMVPLELKAAARAQDKLVLVVDAYTANLPWELMQADGEPLVLGMHLIRQLVATTYRRNVRSAGSNTACIIVNPDTYGFKRRFGGDAERLNDLPEAVREGEAVRQSLYRAGWKQDDVVFCAEGTAAVDVLTRLYERPYRVLVIAAHGVFEAKASDGECYSGVVLSDGLLLTAVEIAQMEVVPEVVFLNCCHLGSVSNAWSAPGRLAYSLASELIANGVRCVVVAGWAVADAAAATFAATFFERMSAGETFGDAVFDARRACYEQHPADNTWGAYQAYGDPVYRLAAPPNGHQQTATPYVAVEEVLSQFERRATANRRRPADAKAAKFAAEAAWVRAQLQRCPAAWRERADVLQRIAVLYADFGADGFAAAREAYQSAAQREDQGGRVALRIVEQLANLEAREGERRAKESDGKAAEVKAGIALIDVAIERLRALDQAAGGEPVEINFERTALLGSALKRKAALLARHAPQRKSEIKNIVGESADAYRRGLVGDPAKKPYNALNALPLDWLSGKRGNLPAACELAGRCADTARRQFADSHSFWDAVMSADADVVAWLFGEPLADPVADLHAAYLGAVATVPASAREWDSVVTQLRLLALLLRVCKDEKAKAARLEQLADRLAPAGSA